MDNETYTTNYYKHKLNSLEPGATYYYRFVTYGPNPPVLENGDLDHSATRLVSETLSFTTKPFPVFSTKMYRGMSTHEEVKNLQETLFILNYYGVANPTPLGTLVDGKFGPMTETAVKAYQSASGLVADGIVGAKTRESLNKLMASWFTSCFAPCTIAGGIPFGTGGVSHITSDSGTLVGYAPVLAQTGTAIGPYYYFEYGTTENLVKKPGETFAKASGELAIPISGLEANTTYYYRFVQKSGSTMTPGWIFTYGTTRSFTTSE
jgi:peptidoglycan hydrolase-like protein with peptidoglycan-binding domain